MDRFEINEIAYLQNQVGDAAPFNGREVTVTGDLRERMCIVMDHAFQIVEGYTVMLAGVGQIVVLPTELRKRRPPTTGEQKIRDMFIAPKQPVEEVA